MKKFKFYIVTFIINLTMVFAYAQETLTMNLTECIRYADEHNLTLRSSLLGVESSEIQLKQAKLKMAPTVSASAGQNFSHTPKAGNFNINGNYNLSAGIDIFNGLNTFNSIKQSQLQLTQSQLQTNLDRDQMHIKIIQSYLTILMNQEMLNYQQQILTTSRQQVVEGEQKYKTGQILESDYLLLESQYLSDSINIENSRIAIDNEYVTLRTLLNLESTKRLSIVTPDSTQLTSALYIPSFEEVLKQAIDYLPELKMLDNSIQIAEYDVKLAKSAYYPTLSASAGIGTGYNSIYGNSGTGLTGGLYDNLSETVGFSLRVPIYQQGTVRNNVKMKQLAVQEAELNKENIQNQLVQEIESYYLDVRKAYNNYILSERQENAYYANFMAYNQKFQFGAITAVDLLQQQNNYFNILNNYMQNKYNFLMIKKTLDVYMGQAVSL